MADPVLARLRVGGVVVADYVDGAGIDPTLAPRPYLHPVRTLGGTVVTDAGPADHPWHLGITVAVPDVDGWNLWGGPTYLRGEGYVARADHGRIRHVGFTDRGDDGFVETLHWISGRDEVLLVEERRVRARPVEPGWELELGTTLTNATGRPMRLAGPAANGRAGAGYGGLFWRLPPGEPQVRTSLATGEQAVHGRPAAWLTWTDPARGVALAVAGTDDATRADPWFVRVADYPGIGSQLAGTDPLVLPPGRSTTRGLRALVADGALADDTLRAWAAAVAQTAPVAHGRG